MKEKPSFAATVEGYCDCGPLVSIVMPVFNTAGTIGQTLGSVTKQTYSNIEIICVDDGSTDGSKEAIMDICVRDERLLCIDNVGKGAGAARNTGLSFANGKYILFLDSDDLFDREMVATEVARMERDELDVLIVSAFLWTEDTGKLERRTEDVEKERLIEEGIELFNPSECPAPLFSIFSNVLWDKMFRVDYLRSKHLECLETMTCNDCYLSRASVVLASKVGISSYCPIRYRVNRGGGITTSREKSPLDGMLSCEKLYEVISNSGSMHFAVESIESFCINELVYRYLNYRSEDARNQIVEYWKSSPRLSRIDLKKGRVGVSFAYRLLYYSIVTSNGFSEICEHIIRRTTGSKFLLMAMTCVFHPIRAFGELLAEK